MDPFEAELWRSIAAAPNVAGPRGVLADRYLEAGSPWGEYMNAERFGQTTAASELRLRAHPEMVAALGGAVGVAGTWLGLPDRVVVLADQVDTARVPWSLVSHLDFAPLVNHRAKLLERGRQAHGWPRLESVNNVSLDELWSMRPWATGRFRSLTVTDLGSATPASLVELLAPRPARVQVVSERLQVVFRDDLPEVWVTCLRAPNVEVLAAVLQHGVQPGQTLVWVNGRPPPELARRLAGLLPEHENALLPDGR
jgi:hypothetical protein